MEKLDKKRRKLSTPYLSKEPPKPIPTPPISNPAPLGPPKPTKRVQISDDEVIPTVPPSNGKYDDYSPVNISDDENVECALDLDVLFPPTFPKENHKITNKENLKANQTKENPKTISTKSSSNLSNKTFKYQEEPIRNKQERQKLKGRECLHCQKFYDAINQGDHKFDRGKFVNECSRHKEMFTPPSTPPGYWDPGFPDLPQD
uniref:DNA endonuclease activator Ctp1 C-terminal domain-containing protein n=1 Tax=Arcella intermedia TaxID=1963864 RepID=A0A6B2LIH7_9EUKA